MNYMKNEFKRMTNHRTLLVFFLLFFIACSYSQGQGNVAIKRDTTRGFDFFFNPGMYIGHKKNANYYRGVPTMESDYADPDIRRLFRDHYYRIDILKLIVEHHRGVVADTFWLEETSGMRYAANLSFGIGARYRFTKNLSIGVVFSQALMTANGIANIGVKIIEINSADVLPYPLVGKERRSFFELNANYIFSTNGVVSPLLEADMHINSTKVISSDLIVEEQRFPLINEYGGQSYDPSISQTKIDRKRGGVGYGFSAAIGLRISFNKWAAIEPIVQFRLEKINLAGYNDITPNYNFMIRLVLGDNVFAKKKSEVNENENTINTP